MEFQAVIMAGGDGSRMTDLTSSIPKALLPVGNMPMVWYPANMLEKAGFESAILVAQESSKSDIEKSLSQTPLTIRLEYVTIPEEADWGTADSLRYLKDKVRPNSDLLIVSCDLLTDVRLHQLADIHRTYDATVTMLLTTVSDNMMEQSIPGVKTKKKIERDYIGLDAKDSKVLFLASEADFDESIPFKKSLMKRHPCINIHTQLSDAHLYLIKRWVLDYLWDQKSISTIKGELIPHLVKKQFSKHRHLDVDQDLPNPNASVISVDTSQDIFSYSKDNNIFDLAQDISTSISTNHQGNQISCYSYIMDGVGFCLRANTLLSYCESNRQISRHIASLAENKVTLAMHPSVNIPQKSQVGSDCMLGEGVSIGDKTSIKRSVIGKHCTIGERVKIANCVIMDRVTIREGSNVQGCVICDRARIDEKCEIKDCIIGSAQQVMAMSKLTNEAVVDIDRMMKI